MSGTTLIHVEWGASSLKNRVVSRRRRDRGHVGAVLEVEAGGGVDARDTGSARSFLAKASMAATSVVGIDAREVEAERGVLAAREVLADLVDRGPAARHVGRHDPVVDLAELDAQERHRQQRAGPRSRR